MAHDHNHGHAHTHDHNHGHHHHHDHAHGAGEYYLEQLLTIGISGAFAIVAILMYRGDMLKLILVPQFHLWVLWGGIALLVLTIVRAVALWQATAPVHNHNHNHHHHEHGPDCEHDHEHGPDCQHEHHHHAHAAAGHHDHDHSHGGIFWRVVVLMFPIALFLMGLPNEGFSQETINIRLGEDIDLDLKDFKSKGGPVQPLTFADLNASALDPDSRAGYEGVTIRVKGQVRKESDKKLTLYHLKMTCCAADMIPLKAQIISEESLGPITDGEWREVMGILQFAQVPGKNHYMPVIRTSVKNIVPTKPEQ